MGKDKCFGGALWEQYSANVRRRMERPQYRGEISEAEAAAAGLRLVRVMWGAEACGDSVQLYWLVDPATETVRKARFLSFGCGTAIASSDMMCELTEGRTVSQALEVNNLVVEAALRDTPDVPAVPPQKMHCSVMAHDVLKQAVAQYRGVDIESLEDQEIVCACARVTLGLVREVIRLNNLTTVEQITEYTKAGAFCKSCIRPGGHEKKERYLEQILRDTRAEMAREALEARRAAQKAAASAPSFRQMNIIRKGNAIQAAIESHVLPILAKDGGACEVVDVRETADGEHTTVYIEYSGACVGCPSAETTTLEMITDALRTAVDPSIDVVVQDSYY